MRIINQYVTVDKDVCTGCSLCEKVCPTLAIEKVGPLPATKVEQRKAKVNIDSCVGCGLCINVCRPNAIDLLDLAKNRMVQVELEEDHTQQIQELCEKADFNPEQTICYCLETRADEVAEAIIQGHRTPEEVSKVTGIGTGCRVLCVESIIRLLKAANANLEKAPGLQWYGGTVTIRDIPKEVRDKYASRGFHFDDDEELIEKAKKVRS